MPGNFIDLLYPYALAGVNIGFGWLVYTILDYSGGVLFLMVGLLVMFVAVSTTVNQLWSTKVDSNRRIDI